MLTEKKLLENGYTKYAPGPFKEYSDALFQKRITDEHGTKYFINIYRYPKHTFENGAVFEEQFQVELSCGGSFLFTEYKPESIKFLEFRCQLFWETFWGKYYEE